jgi:hypothetical protein
VAIMQDASTPAGVQQTVATTVALTTASFTAPANAVLVASWQGNSQAGNPTDPTISDTGGLVWTSLGLRDGGTGNSGQASMWRAATSSSAARTVTVNNNATSGNRQARLKVLVLTGVDTTAPVVASSTGSDSTGALDSLTVTTGVANSWVVGSVSDWDVNSTTLTAAAGTTISDSGSPGSAINGATLRNTTPGASGSSVSLGLTSPTSTAWNFVVAEFRPAAGGTNATPTPSAVAAVGAVLTPGISATATATPARVLSAAAVPTPAISASAVPTPAAVTAVTSIATPAITTGGGGVSQNFFGTGTPTLTGSAADLPVTLGLGFVVTNQGQTTSQVTGIRHYMAVGETGTPVAKLYDAIGTELASANFPTNPGTGWLEATFSSPVTVTADSTTVYVAAVYHPAAQYSYTSAFYSGAVTSGALTTAEGAPYNNGRFHYAGAPTYPENQSSGANYWVDVKLTTSGGGGTGANPLGSLVTAIASVPTPSISAGNNVSPHPAAVTAVAAVPTPAIATGGSAFVTPATVAASAAVVQLSAAVSTRITPDVVADAAAVNVPGVAANTSTNPTPAAVPAVAAVLVPTVVTAGSAHPTPAVVAAITTVRTPTITVPPPPGVWSYWNGSTEVSLTLSGVWTGTSITALTFNGVTA